MVGFALFLCVRGVCVLLTDPSTPASPWSGFCPPVNLTELPSSSSQLWTPKCDHGWYQTACADNLAIGQSSLSTSFISEILMAGRFHTVSFEPWCSSKTRTAVLNVVPRRLRGKSTKTVLKSFKPSFPVVQYLIILSVLLGYCVLMCLHTHLCALNESSVECNCFSCSYFSRGAYRPLQPWLKLFSRFKNASASNFNLPGVISQSLSTVPYMDLQLLSCHMLYLYI